MLQQVRLSPESPQEGGIGLGRPMIDEITGRAAWSTVAGVSRVGRVVVIPKRADRILTMPDLAVNEETERFLTIVGRAVSHLITEYSQGSDRARYYNGVVATWVKEAVAKNQKMAGVAELIIENIAAAKALKMMKNSSSGGGKQDKQLDVLLGDIEGYHTLFSWALGRLRRLPSQETARLGALPKANNDELTRALFPDLVELRARQQPVVLVASQSLPAMMLSLFGMDHVAALVVPEPAIARAGHLENEFTTADVPVLYNVFHPDDTSVEERLQGKYLFYSQIEDGDDAAVKVHISADPQTLETLRKSECDQHGIELQSPVVFNADQVPCTVGLEVSRLYTLRNIQKRPSFEQHRKTPINLVKSEWLMDEGSEKGRHVYHTPVEDMAAQLEEFLSAAGAERTVDIRLFDFVPIGTADKQPVPIDERQPFRERQVRAFVRAARSQKRDVGMMIPRFESIGNLMFLRNIIRDEEKKLLGTSGALGVQGRVYPVPMIESLTGIDELGRLLALERSHMGDLGYALVSRVTIGLGDFSTSIIPGAERRSKTIMHPDEPVILGFQKLADICRENDVELVACGMLLESKSMLIALQSCGIQRFGFQPLHYNSGVQTLKILMRSDCQTVVEEIGRTGSRGFERARLYNENLELQKRRFGE